MHPSLHFSTPSSSTLCKGFNPLKMFQFCPCYVPMESPRKSLNFSHAALVGHQLSRAKRDSPSQQAGSQKNHPILKTRICKYFNFDKKHISTSNLPWVGSGCPPPHLGWTGCLLSACSPRWLWASSGSSSGPCPSSGTPQGPLVADHHLRALIKPIDRLAGSATHANIFVIFISKPNK